MSKKQRKQKKQKIKVAEDEKVLAFEEAKELTVGQAVRKHEEIKAGVTEEDGLLDRYIKQHRDEIEAKKFETQQLPVQEEVEEALTAEATPEVVQEVEALPIHKLEKEVVSEPELPEEAYVEEEEEVLPLKKQVIIWLGLATIFVGVLVVAYLWLNPSKKVETNQAATPSSSSQVAVDTTAFDTLYASFFVDEAKTKLKNSQFDKLSDLKAELEKIKADKTTYAQTKIKYEKLEKAIKAIQTLNNQFDKPVIVDGELDTSAQVKADAKLTKTTTGLTEVDSLLVLAVNHGKGQQTTASDTSTEAATSQTTVESVEQVETAASQEQTTSEETTQATTSQAGGTVAVSTGGLYGIETPAGVTLQRSVSRVPYDQSKIDDANNAAWTFEDGVLEAVISISQQRGYITGNDYILEKVNIINGNGYYNLFKPDGTYLFTLNAKTGYFVGNGSGNSDALDY